MLGPVASGHANRFPIVAGVLDVASVLVFVAIGRSSHHNGVTVGGMVSTSWPFLVGAAVGWAALRVWRRPIEIAPAGVAVWLACVALGMVLRVVAGQGTALAFVMVALAFLGLMLLGWRAGANVMVKVGPSGSVSRTVRSERSGAAD
jgi:peptidoglycan/LPS O-acetylase OafA/YrhL